MKDKPNPISRRDFLLSLTRGAGLTLLGLGGGWSCAGVPLYRATAVNGRVPLDRSDLKRIAEAGKAVLVEVPELPDPIIILVPLAEKARVPSQVKFQAMSARCTHLGCQVRPSRSQSSLRCPCHGSTFDLEGRVIRGPAQGPLTTYPLELEGDQIFIRIPL